MPYRLVAEGCWIALRRLRDVNGEARTYLFCVSEQRGHSCPRDRKSGKKPYELCPACFEQMPEGAFIKEVVYPGILEPKGPMAEPMPVEPDPDASGDAGVKERSRSDSRR